MSHFYAYLYGRDVVVYTGHSAVHAVLETPSANGKNVSWWSKLFGLKSVKIVYRQGKDNPHADALSCSPVPPSVTTSPDVETAPVHASAVQSNQMSNYFKLNQHLLVPIPILMQSSLVTLTSISSFDA